MEFKFNENSKKWKDVKSVEDWIKSFQNSKKNEQGRSALSLAEFCKKDNIEEIFKSIIAPVIGCGNFSLDTAYPEKASRFDTFSKQRIHDLGIYGKTSDNKSIFVGVEAKVNETYNSTLSRIYRQACNNLSNGKSTDLPRRIEQLINKYFPKITSESNVRYQLLYAIAGALCENKDFNILVFLTFKTEKFIEKSAIRNKKDLQDLLGYIDSKKICEGYYKCQFKNQSLFIIEKTI